MTIRLFRSIKDLESHPQNVWRLAIPDRGLLGAARMAQRPPFPPSPRTPLARLDPSWRQAPENLAQRPNVEIPSRAPTVAPGASQPPRPFANAVVGQARPLDPNMAASRPPSPSPLLASPSAGRPTPPRPLVDNMRLETKRPRSAERGPVTSALASLAPKADQGRPPNPPRFLAATLPLDARPKSPPGLVTRDLPVLKPAPSQPLGRPIANPRSAFPTPDAASFAPDVSSPERGSRRPNDIPATSWPTPIRAPTGLADSAGNRSYPESPKVSIETKNTISVELHASAAQIADELRDRLLPILDSKTKQIAALAARGLEQAARERSDRAFAAELAARGV